jgi:hypothetical protein
MKMLQTLFYHFKIPEVNISGYSEQNSIAVLRDLVPRVHTDNHWKRPITSPDHASRVLEDRSPMRLQSSSCTTQPASRTQSTTKYRTKTKVETPSYSFESFIRMAVNKYEMSLIEKS